MAGDNAITAMYVAGGSEPLEITHAEAQRLLTGGDRQPMLGENTQYFINVNLADGRIATFRPSAIVGFVFAR